MEYTLDELQGIAEIFNDLLKGEEPNSKMYNYYESIFNKTEAKIKEVKLHDSVR
jgi:hypothetical protein